MLNEFKREIKIGLMAYKDIRQIITIITVLIFIALVQKENFVTFFIMMSTITCLGYTRLDSRNNVERVILSLPCSRKEYVVSKYLSTGFIIFISTIVALIFNKLLNLLIPTYFEIISFHQIKLVFAFSIIMVALYYILYFSLGQKVASISYYLVFFIFMFGFFLINSGYEHLTRFEAAKIINSPNLTTNLLLFFILILVSILSALISIVFFEKKDF